MLIYFRRWFWNSQLGLFRLYYGDRVPRQAHGGLAEHGGNPLEQACKANSDFYDACIVILVCAF